MANKYDKFFITFSKYNRGSMTEDEISCVVNFFKTQPTYFEQCFIVNEHRNRKREQFEHVHVYVKLALEIRSDKLREKIRGSMSFLEHSKDLDIRKATNPEALLAGYMVKTDDYTLLYSFGITDEYLNECKDKTQQTVEFRTEKTKINVERIPYYNMPYVMKEYILENQFDYDLSLSRFQMILQGLVYNGFDPDLKNLRHTKAKLDLLIDPVNGYRTLEAILNMEFMNFGGGKHGDPIFNTYSTKEKNEE